MSRPLILIVDDEPDIRRMLCSGLAIAAMDTLEAADGMEAEGLLERADLVLLDWMLPDISGLELARRWRRRSLAVPIIMLTARSAESEVVAALESGIDDYVTKPFSPRELAARIRALLRRGADGGAGRRGGTDGAHAEGLHLAQREHRIYLDGVPLRLSPRSHQLLARFIQSPRRALGRDQLAAAWGREQSTGRAVDVYVRRLRAALGDAAPCIETVAGVGYRYNPDLLK